MSESVSNPAQNLSGQDRMASLFATMVMQQTNMALLFMGVTPHPETGQTTRDLDAARLFIDQLEMLESKTKGNLSKDEEKLLRQSLTNLRMSYVDAVNRRDEPAGGKGSPAASGGPAQSIETPAPEGASDDEPRKRYSKKY
jgi:hypothetical protein